MPALWRSTITRAWPTPKVLTGQGKDAACAFRHRSIQWFEEVLGAPVRQVLTDNGHAYRSHDWRHACTQLDSEHIRTRPYTLGTNGKAERLIKTMLGGLGLPLQLPHKRTPHPRPCGLGAVVQQTQTSCLTRGQAPGESCRAGVWSAHLGLDGAFPTRVAERGVIRIEAPRHLERARRAQCVDGV